MNETKEFIIWKQENLEDLEKQYRGYLKHTVVEDEDFDVKATEDFDTWCEEEFDQMHEVRY